MPAHHRSSVIRMASYVYDEWCTSINKQNLPKSFFFKTWPDLYKSRTLYVQTKVFHHRLTGVSTLFGKVKRYDSSLKTKRYIVKTVGEKWVVMFRNTKQCHGYQRQRLETVITPAMHLHTKMQNNLNCNLRVHYCLFSKRIKASTFHSCVSPSLQISLSLSLYLSPALSLSLSLSLSFSLSHIHSKKISSFNLAGANFIKTNLN